MRRCITSNRRVSQRKSDGYESDVCQHRLKWVESCKNNAIELEYTTLSLETNGQSKRDLSVRNNLFYPKISIFTIHGKLQALVLLTEKSVLLHQFFDDLGLSLKH